MEAVATFMSHWDMAMRALDSIAMTLALVLLGSILAAAAGVAGWRGRTYGAIVGGMLMNITIKAMGGGFAAALAAGIVVAGVAFALGTMPFLIQVLRRVRR